MKYLNQDLFVTLGTSEFANSKICAPILDRSLPKAKFRIKVK